MVWYVGMGRMKAFARLLEAGSFSRIVQPDDFKKQKLTDILGELGDANEPNLLDEEDMHVFGLNPMDDPLYLVLCNFCKKTISASQYGSHAELCKYLGFQKACVEVTEADDGTVHKKPTRKRRNKVFRRPPGKQTLLEPTRVDYCDGSKSYQEDPIRTVSSLSTLTDDSFDGLPKLDVLNFGIKDFSTSTTRKDATIIVKPDERGSLDAECSRYQEEQTYVPAPLATKTYYSERSSHLRSSLSVMFHEASEISSSSAVVGSEALEGNLTSPETCHILDELGNTFSGPKEPVHQEMVSGPSSGFRTAPDFRTTKTTISGHNVNHLLRSHTAASVGMLNR